MNSIPAARAARRAAPVCALIVASFFLPAPAQAQSPWSSAEVGEVSAAGSDSGTGPNATVAGSGADIWDRTDEFHYRYVHWKGDGTFIVRVTGMTNTNGWAKAGLMVRESLVHDSPHAMVCVNPGDGAGFFTRATAGALTDFAAAPSTISHMWLRLVRSGNTFTAAQSSDGGTWQQIGSPVTLALPYSALVGLAVTSHADGTLCTATFENLDFNGPPPPAPTNLTASAVSTTSVQLAWTDNATDEDNYEVARSTDGTNYEGLGIFAANTTSLIDPGVSPGTTYYYRVAAFRNGIGAVSNIATVTTTAGSAPPPPDYLSAAPSSTTSIALNWNDAANNETGYRIARSSDGTVFTNIADLPANSTDYNATGLATGQVYYFRVAAFSGAGEAYSPLAAASTFQASPTLPTPANFVAATESSSAMRLSWDAYTANADRLELEHSADGVSFTHVYYIGPQGTSTFDNQLRPETRYYWRLRALNTGSGAYSDYTPVVSAVTSAVPAPTNLRAVAVSSTELQLSWSATFEINTIYLERSTDGTHFTQILQRSVNAGPYNDEGLSAGITYYYRIRGSRDWPEKSYYSAYSPVLTTSTQSAGAPPEGTFSDADVGAVSAAGSTSSSGGLFTLRGSGEDIWGTADEFHYYYRSWSGDGMFILRVTDFQNASGWAKAGVMLRTDLTAGSAHAYAAVSPEQNLAFVWRPTAGAASQTTVSVRTEDKAMPMWVKLIRQRGQFAMQFSKDGVAWRAFAPVSLALPDNLYAGLAITSHADGSVASALVDNVAFGPVTPNALAGTARSPTRIDLRWVDNDLDETGYEIERSTDNASFTRIATLAANSAAYSDTSVGGGTGYYYRVRSVSAAGPSGYSNVLSILTPPTPPAGWTAEDIGNTTRVGSSQGSGGTFTIAGAGSGVASITYEHFPEYRGDFGSYVPGYADEFQYCWKPWTGDGEIVARVTGLSGSDTGTAGLMVRAGDTTNVYCYVTPAGRIGVSARPGTATGYDAEHYRLQSGGFYDAAGSAPVWLKLVRVSGGVMAYASANGASWSELAWINTPLGADVHFGLGASSNNDGSATVAATRLAAQFDNVTVGPITTPIAPPQPPTIRVGTTRQTSVELTWDRPASAYDRMEIERSTDGVSFTTAATNTANGTWTDGSLASETNYYYRARLIRASETSGYSGVVTARTAAYPAAPTNLVASDVTFSSAVLTWTDNSTAEGNFMIQRSTDGANFDYYTYVDANVTSYRVSLSAGATVYFRVEATPQRPDGTRALSNIVAITPGNGGAPAPAAPGNLVANATQPTRVDLSWNDNSSDETGFVVQRSSDGTTFTDLAATAANTPRYSDTTVNGTTTYYYRVAAARDTARSSWSNVATATTPAITPTGGVWQGRDIGAVAASGSDNESGGSVTVTASGADIWNAADEFHYRFQPLTGDAELIARVGTLGNTNGWAKAGLMFRESLAPDSRHAFMCVSAAMGTALQSRATTGGDSATSPPAAGAAPIWLRIVRSGNTFIGYTSADGANWTLAGSVTLSGLPAGIYAGLAVTSHNDGTVSTATFTNVTVTQGAAPAPLPAPTNLQAMAAIDAPRINLTWTDNSSDETGFTLERSTDGTSFAPLTTLAANSSSYADITVAAATTYYYRVFAARNASMSTASNVASATTVAGSSPPPSGTWSSQDLGGVAAAGSDSETSGRVTVAGSGADIWNAADEFRYRYQTWSGDGEIVARVTSLDDTNGWAKAAVMFRESLTADSRHAMMCVSIAHGTSLQYRAATGGDTAAVSVSEGAGVPRWLKLTRHGDTFTGFESADGTTWTNAGSITVTMPSTIYVGLAVTSHNDGVLCAATFENVSIATSGGTPPPPPPPPPATWSFGDIGNVGLAGTNNSSGNTITISGSGADIWGGADAFRFVYRSWTGDGAVEAQVSSMDYTNGWAKAGVMIRESADAGARNVFACITPDFQGIVAQARAAANADTMQGRGPAKNAPYWVRLTRTGNTIAAATSPDGVTWTNYASYTMQLPETLLFGFAVTSHDNAQLNTAVFTDPSVH